MKRDAARRIKLVLLFAAVLALMPAVSGMTGCVGGESIELPALADFDKPVTDETARTHLKVGVILGPYSNMFEEAIKPSLVDKGYSVELVQYNDYSLPNEYLVNGQTDLNMFQNYSELIDYKTGHDVSITAIAEVPTVTMGVFSEKYRSLSELGEGGNGLKVCLPGDSANFSRALAVLEDAGIITLNPYIDKVSVPEAYIISNPYNIELFPLEAHLLPHSLPEFDLAVIDGYFALIGGLNLADALYTEKPDANRFVVIAVRTEDLPEQFVEDILHTLRTREYRAVIEDPGKVFLNFQRPPNFYSRIGSGE